MPPRRAEPVDDRRAENARLDHREIGLEDDPLGPHVGLGMLAEGEDAPARRGGGVGAEALVIGIVAIEDGGAALLEALEDLALGVGDAPDRAEILDVDRLHRRDDRHLRPHEPRQRRDLARVVHADLEDAEGAAPRHAGEGQGHAPVIVVGGESGVRGALARQHEAHRLLGAGLADGARDGDDLRARPGAGAGGEIAHGPEHVRHDDQRPAVHEVGRPRFGDDRRGGALGESVADEVMAVAGVALDGEEQVARLEGARVDRDPGHRADLVRDPAARRGGDLIPCPERSAHPCATRAMAARRTSWSENGRVRSPMIWPVS